MTVFGLVLGHRLLTIFALPLIRLKPIFRASWASKEFVLANFTRAILDAAGTCRERIRSSDFREFRFAFLANHIVKTGANRLMRYYEKKAVDR